MRVARTVHQRIAGRHALAFLHVDVNAARDRVFALLAIVADDVDLARTLGDFAVLHDTVDFGDHRRFTRLAGFEQFDDARQTAGDVLGLRGGARDLGQHVAGVNFVAVAHHKVSVRRHQVRFSSCLACRPRADDDRRDAASRRANR